LIYESFHGLRITAAEVSIFVISLGILLMAVRFVRLPIRPRWLDWVLDSQLRPVLLVIAVAMIGRALLLPFAGVPEPRVNDEFSYLLMADTFAHHRLANPTPASWEHFETFHVNLRPTYHSMYPVAQGLALAFGQTLFHQPWVGVYLSTSLLCGAICWALQSFVPPLWALVGGLLAVMRIALFGYWMNSYWGGSVAALGGALALGAVVRLFDRDRENRSRTQLAGVFAAALLILAASRPYEGMAFSLPLLGYFAYHIARPGLSRDQMRATLLPVLGIGMLGLVMLCIYNHETTGDALVMPYVLNHRTYWSLPFFLGQKGSPELELPDPVFTKFMTITADAYGYERTKTASGLATIELGRVIINWFFYIGPALTLPVLIGLRLCIGQPRLRIVVWAILFTAAAAALCLYNLVHYAAPATVAVYLLAVVGLRHLWDKKERRWRALVIAACFTVVVASLTKQTGSEAKLYTFHLRDGRKAVIQQLQEKPGRHLVLVSYELDHHYPASELVHNGAEFDSQRILWARSKGTEKDANLCQAFGDRDFWAVTTDDVNLSLKPLELCKRNPGAQNQLHELFPR
jgi:hypothetical protein